MRYRLLPVEEWHRLHETFDFPGPVPSELHARVGLAAAAVAEDEDGQIRAVLFLQMVLHAEPMMIAPEAQGRVNFERLAGVLEEAIVRTTDGRPVQCYVFTPNARIARMCKRAGLQQLPWRVWVKTVRGGE